MSADGSTEAVLISSIQLATKSAIPDEFEDKNYAFNYLFQHANRYLPQAVLGLHTMKTLASLHESDSKMGRIFSRFASAYEYAMYSCSSIDGKMLNDMLVKKVIQKQTFGDQPPQGNGLFGGNKPKPPF